MFLCAAMSAGCCASASPSDRELTVFVGSYSGPDDNALKAYRLNPADCTAKLLYEMPVDNASFLTVSPSGTIYAVSETGPDTSEVTALRRNADGKGATILNRQLTGGDSPCYIAVSPDGRFVITANYGDGTVTIFPVNDDGTLGERVRKITFEGHGPVESRQKSSHPHCISFTPDGNYMLVNDLGTDRINLFRLGDNERLTVSDTPDFTVELEPGSGPRHIVFNKKGDTAYLLNEISDKVTVLRHESGKLRPLQYIAADTAGAHGAGDIHISPDGKRLYCSLRLKHEGIATFDIDPETGLLAHAGHTLTGGHPRNFTIADDGRLMLVACRDAGGVEISRIDSETGSLTKAGFIPQEKAVFVKVMD